MQDDRLPVPRFMERTNQRTLPPDYTGDILVWDIDKTYLETRFSSFRGLLGIVAEAALDKEAVPGAVPLLRALRRGGGPQTRLVPLYFVSGSPPQLRGILERKMTLDGVQYDGITFKDQLALLRARRPRAIKEQVGYKLSALLLYRRETPDGARWLLFGDDVERDAEVFTLFGQVCAGLRGAALAQQMRGMGGMDPEVATAVALAEPLPVTANPVRCVFIRLDRGRDPATFPPGVMAVHSFLQAALVLHHMGCVQADDIAAVAQDLRRAHTPEAQITAWLEDAHTRLGVPQPLLHLAGQ